MYTFATSMKEKYKDRLINRENQWPPQRFNKFVRLELVEREKRESHFANVQRGREDKTFKRTPLAYSDLFKEESGKERVRKVLVEGDAGIGKTTLSISFSADWACGQLFREFELVLLLSLRHNEVASAGSLYDLLKLFHSDPEVCEAVASYLEKGEAKKVLIIADGWDELSESERREGSFLYQLLFKTFHFMSVVVTSRPSASAPLHNVPYIDRFVEVSGFNKNGIKEYIQSEFSDDTIKGHHLLQQLEHNPLIESVCSIPLSCVIVCHLWHTLDEALPSTMTELYTKLILYIVCRNLRKLGAYGPTFGICNFDDFPDDLKQPWWRLCQFAFEALEKDEIVFSKPDLLELFPEKLAINEKILCFGLLESVKTVLDITCVVSFNFVHLTFMEYLAALYLSRQPLDRQLQLFEKNRFNMVSKFFFGICFSGSNRVSVTKNLDVKRAIKCVVGTGILGGNRLTLCHCAFESQNRLVIDEVVQFVIDNALFGLEFGHPHTAHDCAAILYVINNMQELRLCGLNIIFRNSGISENQIRTLTDILTRKNRKLQIKELDLSGNKLADKSVSNLFVREPAAFQSLTELNLGGNCIGAESIKSITSALAKSSSNRCRLSSLSLSDNFLGMPGLQALERAVHEHLLFNLKFLFLRRSLNNNADTNAAWLTTFVQELSAHCPHLEVLDLSQNNLGISGAKALARVIARQQQSKGDGASNFSCLLQPHFASKMYLNQTNFGDNGLCAFIENIRGIYHLEELYLQDNDIHATGISCLADAICSGKIVTKCGKLDLTDNPLGAQGTVAVARLLSSDHCRIETLYLTRCQLTRPESGLSNIESLNLGSSISVVQDVGKQLCQMPPSNAITWLHLDGNNFTGEGIHVLAGFMHICKFLKRLFSSNCGINSNDLERLFDKLSKFKSSSTSLCCDLELWYLNNNEIDDSSVSAIVKHLPALFPRLHCGPFEGIDLSKILVSSKMEKLLMEKLTRHKQYQSPFESSSNGYSKGQKKPLLLSSTRLNPLAISQYVDIHRERRDGSVRRGNANVGPGTGEPALDVHSTHIMEKERSGVQSHDSSDSENDIFLTPPTSPISSILMHNDKSTKLLTASPTHEAVVPYSAQLKLMDLDLIEIVNWQRVGLRLGVKEYELKKIELDYQRHDDRKREMFSVWLATCINPNKDDLIKALEVVGEKKAAQQLRDKS